MSQHIFRFELGERVKDCITGMSGVITARSNFITGCDQYGISPTELTKEGKRPDWEYFDENRLIKTGKGITLPKLVKEGSEVKGFDGKHSSKN